MSFKNYLVFVEHVNSNIVCVNIWVTESLSSVCDVRSASPLQHFLAAMLKPVPPGTVLMCRVFERDRERKCVCVCVCVCTCVCVCVKLSLITVKITWTMKIREGNQRTYFCLVCSMCNVTHLHSQAFHGGTEVRHPSKCCKLSSMHRNFSIVIMDFWAVSGTEMFCFCLFSSMPKHFVACLLTWFLC